MSAELPRLAGTVALVTGAGRGIGLAIARRFAREGARVVVNDIDALAAEAAARSIVESGGEAVALPADVSRKPEVDRLFDAALERFGDVSVLVNNAGLVDVQRHFLEADEEWWDRVLDTNLKSHFLCALRAAPLMARRGGGCIINISSGGATRAHRGMAAYDASKGGVEALTRALALDLGPYRIRVNAIVPGIIITAPAMSEEAIRERDATVPLGRAGTPDDVAGPAVFLASDDARYMTGSMLLVDGGLLGQQRSPQIDIFPPERFPRVELEPARTHREARDA